MALWMAHMLCFPWMVFSDHVTHSSRLLPHDLWPWPRQDIVTYVTKYHQHFRQRSPPPPAIPHPPHPRQLCTLSNYHISFALTKWSMKFLYWHKFMWFWSKLQEHTRGPLKILIEHQGYRGTSKLNPARNYCRSFSSWFASPDSDICSSVEQGYFQ